MTTFSSGPHLHTAFVDAPSPTASDTLSLHVALPICAGTAGGTYFLLACADYTLVVPETNESNNCKASATQVTVSGPDLVETVVSNPPTTVKIGRASCRDRIEQNIGSAAAEA